MNDFCENLLRCSKVVVHPCSKVTSERSTFTLSRQSALQRLPQSDLTVTLLRSLLCVEAGSLCRKALSVCYNHLMSFYRSQKLCSAFQTHE